MAEGKGIPTYALVGGAVVAALAIGFWLSGGGGGSGGIGDTPGELEAQLRAGELRDQEKQRAEKVVLARVSQQRAVDTGTRALELLDVSLKEEVRWREEVEPLLSNQQGRVLAADDVLVEGFVQVYADKRPTRAELDATRPRIEALLSEPRAAVADPNSAYQPTEQLAAELERERATLEQAASAYRISREKVEGLLASAKARGVAPGGIPLEQAISERKAQSLLALAEAEAQRKERHRLEEEQKQAALDETLHQQRLQAMDAQAEQDRLALERKAATVKQVRDQEAERERLLLLANDPAIQALFTPFLAKGRYNLGRNFPLNPPAPTSYNALQRLGATSDVKEFVRRATEENNDRPLWKKPQTEEEWTTASANLELFNQLAPIWVEQGKLSP